MAIGYFANFFINKKLGLNNSKIGSNNKKIPISLINIVPK